MRVNPTFGILTTVLLATLLTISRAGALSGSLNPHNENYGASAHQEIGFTLSPLPEDPKRYSLVITDDNERSISGSFSTDQLQILRAIMTEAEKFALASEPVRTKDPVTTRFTDEHETAFIVDVQKSANESLLFLTLKTEIGRVTWEAGRFIRSTRREGGFFFELLTRLESILPKLPSQLPK